MRTIYGKPLAEFLKDPWCSMPKEHYTPSVMHSGMWLIWFRSQEIEFPRLALDNPKGGRPIEQRRWGHSTYSFSIPYSVVPQNGEEEDAIHRAAIAIFAYKDYPGVTKHPIEITRTKEDGYYPWTPEEVSFHQWMLKGWD